MTLRNQLHDTFSVLLNGKKGRQITSQELIECLDLTLLDEQAALDSLHQLHSLATNHPVAAVCIYPKHLHEFSKTSTVNRAIVLNFPQGNYPLLPCLDDLEYAVQQGANEIDFVIPYTMYLNGQKTEALNYCQSIIHRCKQHQVTIKIILEVGRFPHLEDLYQISSELIILGADFLKTSTGKITLGADLAAVFVLLTAIKDSESDCGIKISGGIKSRDQALSYAYLAECILGKKINKDWFRIGSSSLLADLLEPHNQPVS